MTLILCSAFFVAGICRGEAAALVFLMGKTGDDVSIRKVEAIEVHLFGIIMTDVLMVVLPDAVHILTNPNKCKILTPLTTGSSNDVSGSAVIASVLMVTINSRL